MQSRVALFLCLILAACSGGGGGGGAIPHSAPNPGSTATAAPQGNHLAAAPATVYTATGPQSLTWRKAQSIRAKSVALGNGGIPTVVVGYSPTMGAYFSQLYTWAENAQATPVPEASAQVSVTGPMTIQAVNQDNTNAFSLTEHDWIINPGPLTGTGKIEVAVLFSDGTTGEVPYYAYDKWNLGCGVVNTPGEPSQIGYQAGTLVGDQPANDVAVDCGAQNLFFANGAILLSPPIADAYGNLASQMTTMLSANTALTPTGSVAFSQLQIGAIYLVRLSDGGFAKFMPMGVSYPGPTLDGIMLHDSPSGSGKFAF